VKGFSYIENEDILRLGGFVVGRGNEKQRKDMVRVLNDIPRNRLILKAFFDLVTSKSELERRAKK
jgi:hypothetical protein